MSRNGQMNPDQISRKFAPVQRARGRDYSRVVALVGSYPPRQCGIATFTSDLAKAMSEATPNTEVEVVAINDVPGGYSYPPEVRLEVGQNRLQDYHLASELLNMSNIDAVYVQHEYGIFGGVAGDHIVGLLKDLRMPVITTLHTILREPSTDQRRMLCHLAAISDRLVTMSETGRNFLREVYGVREDKIEVIPHGVPDMPFVDPNCYKEQFGVEGKKVLLTFGLLSPNKGIETVIRALPIVVCQHPEIVYLVVGATHPHVKTVQGESYRLRLQQLASDLGVEANVAFHNRFVDLAELCEFLGAADIYVSPHLNEAQIASGTLSYAMSTGKATICTPYWYALEMLAEGRGRIVPFGDAEALASEIDALLENEGERHAVRKRAYAFTRSHIWKEVARRYLNLLDTVHRERRCEPRRALQARTPTIAPMLMPEISLDHMGRLTDDVGILQHATYSVPNRAHGYCADDNARALAVAILAQGHVPRNQSLAESSVRYLAFLQHAFNPETAAFRNFLGYDRRWLESEGSEDSQGRVLWALGVAVRASNDDSLCAVAAQLFRQGLPSGQRLAALRASAFALLGVDGYLQRFPGDTSAKRLRCTLAERLMQGFASQASSEWPWPEGSITYSNASLPHALLVTGRGMGRDDMVETGLRALRSLVALQMVEGRFVPIGNDGWYWRGGKRARFDQQPIEADTMIGACIEAFRITDDRNWLDRATRSFRWFLGQNDLGVPLYDDATGECSDGLQPTGLNQNHGAESTLAWMHALIQMRAIQAEGLLQVATGNLGTKQPERAEVGA